LTTRAQILQLGSFLPALEQGLQQRFHVHRWPDDEPQEAWLTEHAQDVRGLVTGANLGVRNALIARLPALGIIAINGVGFDRVELPFARSRGIRVTNTPDVLTDDVADLTLGLIIGLLRDVPAADRYVRDGRWLAGPMPLGRKVSGRRFGIIGLGRIGRAIAARLEVLGPVAYSARAAQADQGRYRYVADPLELARDSDVLVLAASVTDSSRRLVGRALLDALGPEGYLVNIARGTLIDQQQLISALQERRIAGAALDVYDDEPRVPDALRALPNVVLTPHIGSATHDTRAGMARMVLASLDAFFAGTPVPNALT
jgi:lactate dehydrogenase-like 2-hydroxyacid dehydrogenase